MVGSGQYNVIQEIAEIGGYVCKGSQSAAIWRPDAEPGTKFPLISFAHGFGGGGPEMHNSPMLNKLASQGYVIIGNKSAAKKNFECEDMYKD